MRIISILCDRINSLLAQKDISVSELERSIGVGNGTIRAWLRQESPNPQLDKLVKIADLFGTTVAYLIGETNSVEKGLLVRLNENHIWDYLLPLNKDECQWIAVKRFVSSRSSKPLDEKDLEELVNRELERK